MPDEMPAIDWHKAAGDYYGHTFAHPLNPELSVADFQTATDLATATKFGGHASPHEAGLFWREFKELGMTPKQYLERLKPMSLLSFRLHNRPPSMDEIKKAHEQDWDPSRVKSYYDNLPHRDLPDLTAKEYIAAHTKARLASNQTMGRDPYDHEVQFFHHSGMGHDAIRAHYTDLRTPPAAPPDDLQGQPAPPEQGHPAAPQPGRPPA